MAITAREAIEAIRDSRGFVTVIAKRLGCSRRHVYNLRDKYVSVAEALEDEREKTKDWVESKIVQRMDEGSDTMLIFYAKTQMKDRGYVERQEVTGADGGPIVTKVDLSDLTDDELDQLADIARRIAGDQERAG